MPITVLYAAIGTKMLQYRVDVEPAPWNRSARSNCPAPSSTPGQSTQAHPPVCRLHRRGPPSAGAGGQQAPAGGAAHRPQERRAGHGRPAGAVAGPHRAHDPGRHRPPCRGGLQQSGRVTLHRIAADGTLQGDAVPMQDIDCGSYPHQIRVTPSNRHVVLVTRGTRPTATTPGTPGALKVYASRMAG